MLKILEEPPEYVIFLLCTTDPQKILPTIMSRIQRFNFSRIPNADIVNRLKYIIDAENKDVENAGLGSIIYEEQALEYIARLSKGGMRDSITTLEKCLDYSRELTVANILKVTSGSITEDVMCQFLTYILNKDARSALIALNSIYMSGIDISLFVKMLTEFVQNLIKYLITRCSDITTLSPVAISWVTPLSVNLKDFKNLLESLVFMRTDFNYSDIKIVMESWIIEKCS